MTVTFSEPWCHDCWTTCIRFSIEQQSKGVKLGQFVTHAGYLPFAFLDIFSLYHSSHSSLLWKLTYVAHILVLSALWVLVGFGQWGTSLRERSMGGQRG